MKSTYIGIGLALCLGMCIAAAGQAEESGQNAPPLPPGAEALPPELPVPPELQDLKQADAPPPLPPELQGLEQADAPPPLPPELQGLEQADAPPPLPPELQQLQQMMEQAPEPPSLPKEEVPPAAEKPVAESAAATKDKRDIKAKSNEVP